MFETTRPLKPVRVAVIGLGRMGVAHTAVLSMIPDCEVVGLCDRHPSLGKSLRGMGHRAPFFRNPAILLEKTSPDAVFVCTQSDSHAALARLALEAGSAVFVEKPLAHTLEDAAEMAALAKTLEKPLACGYTLAYVPIFAAARHAIAAGAVGLVRQARSSMYLSQTFGPRKGWMYDERRSGGGVVANVSSHLLFLLQWCLGPPVEVRATSNKIFSRVEDELHAMMRLESGAEVGFDSSWSVPGYPYSAVVIEVEGDNGRMLVSNDALELELSSDAGGYAAGSTMIREGDLPQPARFHVNSEGYYLEDADFLRWATGGPEPPIAVEAALGVQRTMHALYESAREGGRVTPVSS
jgi:predicted dehydrogenase